MNGTRVSVGGLLAVISFAAIGLAALRESSDLWAGLINASALGFLGVAVLGAILRRGAPRAFWLGFALFGWGYLALASGPQTIRRLPTTASLEWLRSVMSRAPGSPGDRLLVMRQGKPTPAMILEVKDGTFKVNFDGWTSYHDEWIGVDRVTGTLPATPPAGGVGAPPLAAYLPFSGAENFLLIGHSLFALMVGTIGGLVARFFMLDRNESVESNSRRQPLDAAGM